ncbi:MAG: alpha/beta hydrolase [Gammaproteobacteria bacterium]|nr:alpha/beta hydrolase [Gammaproteobacteria bacterium]MDH5654084.1 alpha/beta hydrolase [Gammaproteobacteria bacterium]
MAKRFFLLSLLGLLLIPVAQADDYTVEELERWFNSDKFEPPNPVGNVNDGELEFLTALPKKKIHHHHNSVTILPNSLQDGWVIVKQCHSNIDQVSAAQVVFKQERVKDLQVLEYQNIGRAWVEGPTVQMTDITANATICLQARTRALYIRDDGSYCLRNGPFMRRFLDGYYPIRVSMDIVYKGTGLKLVNTLPKQQAGFSIWQKQNELGFDAVFEGQLRTEFSFEVETLI